MELENTNNNIQENEQQDSEQSTEVSKEIDLSFSIQDMIDANWYFGGLTKKRNQRMNQYIYESKFGNDIINIFASKYLLEKALQAVVSCVAHGGRVLFVGTESNFSKIVEKAAYQAGQYYVSKRWVGGLLTNWISFHSLTNNIKRIEQDIENNRLSDLSKQERNKILKKKAVFERFLGGVKDMAHSPNMIVTTSDREFNPIREAKILGIPVISLLDTTSNPMNITHPVPGNNRSITTVEMFCNLISMACLVGLQKSASVDTKAESSEQQNKHSGSRFAPRKSFMRHKKYETRPRYNKEAEQPKSDTPQQEPSSK